MKLNRFLAARKLFEKNTPMQHAALSRPLRCRFLRIAPVFLAGLLASSMLLNAGGGDGGSADGAAGPSQNGYTPNATITTVAGIEVDQHRLNLAFNVPLTPTFKVVDGVYYSITARYSSNITNHNYVVTSFKSPFGIGYEFGFGQIFESYHDGINKQDYNEDYRRTWSYQSPDGSVHSLHLLRAQPGVLPAEELNGLPAHAFGGNGFLIQTGGAGPWSDFAQSAWEYYSVDGSLLKAKYHPIESGNPSAWWEIFFPDGRRAEFRQRNAKPASVQSSEEIDFTRQCLTNSRATADSESLYSFLPTRVESALNVGFSLFYENAGFPAFVTRIADDTSRRTAASLDTADPADLTLIVDATGHYSEIRYPAANGQTASVHLTYANRPITGKIYSCTIASGCSFSSSAWGSRTGTFLEKVELPPAAGQSADYAQSFEYYTESDDPAASGRIKAFTTPNGGRHEFTYKIYPFLRANFNEATGGRFGPFGLGVLYHDLYTRQGAGGTDHMRWSYVQNTVRAAGSDGGYETYDTANDVIDPAGNKTRYVISNWDIRGYMVFTPLTFSGGSSNSAGLLFQTDYFEGTTTLKKRVTNEWTQFERLPRPEKRFHYQLTKATTELYDDIVGGKPGTIIEENLGYDYWGRFTTKRTRGSLVPKMRQTVTTYALDPAKVSYADHTFFPSGDTTHRVNAGMYGSLACNSDPGADASFHLNGSPGSTNANYGTISAVGCDGRGASFSQWRPSLPLRQELQEFDGTAWIKKSRTETAYDAATGLPVRAIARKDFTAPAGDPCTASLTPQAGDITTDLYYDTRGNLALKKVSGGDDGSVFRSYSGTGDKPSVLAPPTTAPTIGPDNSESIYCSDSRPGGCAASGHFYFGPRRWSREFTGDAAHGGEGGEHQFINGFTNTADYDRASATALASHDANGLTSTQQFDLLGRVTRTQFIGDGSAAPDLPATYRYIDDGASPPHLIGIESITEDPADPTQKMQTQDYYDGLSRKVLVRRRNPDGQFAFQAMHYDRIGHADFVSNWSFITPPGLDDPDHPVPTAWTGDNLLIYITQTVGAYTRSCFSAGCNASLPYEFAGRVLRVERQDHAELISAVDTEYFGLNTRTTVHGINTPAGDTCAANDANCNAATTHYTDGYGNLRVVDADAGTSSAQQGVDAIYDYDYANRLVKVNLVPQVTLSPVDNHANTTNFGQDRYTTTNADHQLRSFVFDTLGRQIQTTTPETGTTKYLRFNAMGAVLETEDENGRVGGGPIVGSFPDTLVTAPSAPCPAGGCPPTVKIVGIFASNGKAVAEWVAAGRLGGTNGAVVAQASLYYRVTYHAPGSSPVVGNWTLGQITWNQEGLQPVIYNLTVEASYTANPSTQNIGSASQQFSESANPDPYHLVHQYDARGRETLVIKYPAIANNSTLRSFTYESATANADCTATRSCGKLTDASALPGTTNEVRNHFDFRLQDGRAVQQTTNLPLIVQPLPAPARQDYTMSFDYDPFGRQSLASYPKSDGTPDVQNPVQLQFQYGGVKQVNRLHTATNTVTAYATIGRAGDYAPDGSLFAFLQGNGLAYHRVIDSVERTSRICYNSFPTNPEFLAACTGQPQKNLWDSGKYAYDGAGNISAIGADSFSYDRLNRLKTATINRHPHTTFANGTQPDGFVSLNYAYDAFGNITGRQIAAQSNYTVGQNPLEIFAGRDYTLGMVPVTDNQIHNPGFLYDGNGNLVSDGVKDYLYDALNQQVEVHQTVAGCTPALAATNPHSHKVKNQAFSASTACYGAGTLVESNVYGPDGMRAARDVPSIILTGSTVHTVYVRLGGNVVKEFTQEFDTSSSTNAGLSHEKTYIYGPLGLLATDDLCNFHCKDDETSGVTITRYYEYDHLGTIRAITDSLGNLETTFDYEPFGLELKGTTYTWGTDTSSNTHKFTGHERDEDAGEDYMKARMYVLSTARFPQIDPMFGGAGNPQNWNPYIYVMNSPVGSSDPTGMKPNDPPLASGGPYAEIGNAAGGGGATFDNNAAMDAMGGPMSPVSPIIKKIENTLQQAVKTDIVKGAEGTGVAQGASPTPAGGGNGGGGTAGASPLPAGQPGSPFQGPPAPTEQQQLTAQYGLYQSGQACACQTFAIMAQTIMNGNSSNATSDSMDALARAFTEKASSSYIDMAGQGSSTNYYQFDSSGFKPSVYEAPPGNNQVRHAVAGIIAGYRLGATNGMGVMNFRENKNDAIHGQPDINLNRRTVAFGAAISGEPGRLLNIGGWINSSLCSAATCSPVTR